MARQAPTARYGKNKHPIASDNSTAKRTDVNREQNWGYYS